MEKQKLIAGVYKTKEGKFMKVSHGIKKESEYFHEIKNIPHGGKEAKSMSELQAMGLVYVSGL